MALITDLDPLEDAFKWANSKSEKRAAARRAFKDALETLRAEVKAMSDNRDNLREEQELWCGAFEEKKAKFIEAQREADDLGVDTEVEDVVLVELREAARTYRRLRETQAVSPVVTVQVQQQPTPAPMPMKEREVAPVVRQPRRVMEVLVPPMPTRVAASTASMSRKRPRVASPSEHEDGDKDDDEDEDDEDKDAGPCLRCVKAEVSSQCRGRAGRPCKRCIVLKAKCSRSVGRGGKAKDSPKQTHSKRPRATVKRTASPIDLTEVDGIKTKIMRVPTGDRKRVVKSEVAKERDRLSSELAHINSLMQGVRGELMKQQGTLLTLMGRMEDVTAKLEALDVN